jgi:L-prolyl-[peptidyl-carrier protein] dehydrogenase
MDFDLTPEQLKRADHIRAAAGTPLFAPTGRMAGRDAWRAAGQLGLTGLCLPREHGGGGLGALDTALALEAFCDGSADTGLAFGIAAHLLACARVLAEYAPGLLTTDIGTGRTVAGNAMTEDEAGSDVGRLATTAVADGDSYVLTGVKSFVSNAPLADVFITYAVTAPEAGFLGTSAFAVARDLPGVRIGEPLVKMGLEGCGAARVEFAGCRVPRDHRLGAEGAGGQIFQRSMAWERACLPAIYLGAMGAQLRRCVVHARQRRQFGRSIADFQAVSHRLATMRQRLESSRLLLYRACWCVDQDHPDATEAGAIANVAVAEAAVANGLDAVRLFGARGYLAADGIERQLRDAVPMHIFSGTTDVQREIIAKGMVA